jgi:hypothetical protein
MSLRHDQGGLLPEASYANERTRVWFDEADLRPLSERYPQPAEAPGRAGSGGRMSMHIAVLLPCPQRVASSVRELRAQRLRPDVVRLTGGADPAAECALEFRSQGWRYGRLGASGCGQREHRAGGLLPGAPFEFTIRCDGEIGEEGWVTASVASWSP